MPIYAMAFILIMHFKGILGWGFFSFPKVIHPLPKAVLWEVNVQMLDFADFVVFP